MDQNGTGASATAAVATAATILSVSDLKTEDFTPDGWNFPVRIRELTAVQRESFMSTVAKVMKGNEVRFEDPFKANLILAAHGLVNPETGQPMFPNVQDGMKALGQKSAKAIDDIGTHVLALSGMGTEDVQAAGKKSGETPNGASSSPSA